MSNSNEINLIEYSEEILKEYELLKDISNIPNLPNNIELTVDKLEEVLYDLTFSRTESDSSIQSFEPFCSRYEFIINNIRLVNKFTRHNNSFFKFLNKILSPRLVGDIRVIRVEENSTVGCFLNIIINPKNIKRCLVSLENFARKDYNQYCEKLRIQKEFKRLYGSKNKNIYE
jgi:hypothetical protein